MSFFGNRRGRTARVFRPNTPILERIRFAGRDYRVVSRLGVILASVLMLLLAMQAGFVPFRLRIGQVIDSGIQARTDFEVVNEPETRRQREEAAERAPLVFRHDPTALDRLEASLRAQLGEIASAERIRDLQPSTQESFGWSGGSAARESDDPLSFEFVRQAVTSGDAPLATRVEILAQQVSQLLGSARLVPIMVEKELQEAMESPEATPRNKGIEILGPQQAPQHYGILTDVLLEPQLTDSGRIGRLWNTVPELSALRGAVEAWLRRNLSGCVRYDPAATTARREELIDEIPQQVDSYSAGTVLVPPQTQLSADDPVWFLLNREHDSVSEQVPWTVRGARILGAGTLLTLLVVFVGLSLNRLAPELLEEPKELLRFAAMCAASVWMSRVFSSDPWRAEIVPLLAVVMIVAVVYDQSLALMTAFVLSMLVSIGTLGTLSHFVVLLSVSASVSVFLRGVSSRSTLIKLGFMAAGVGFVTAWCAGLVDAGALEGAWRNPAILKTALKAAGWSLVCCYLVAGSLPFVESLFGIVTDISLLELSDVSHPLLQELARRAPGSYNHSITVATIGEAAADAIGANGLLLRVGAYFHDIGKMQKPEYFVENMTEGAENPHNALAPAMSKLIIIGHVRDGMDLAEQHHLPRRLIDFIEQHHGTTLVEYFFHQATLAADEDHRTNAEESEFRYPGRRPQTRETAVMMLADAVESASRSLSEPTPKRIQTLVRDITMKRLLDGQFDECELRMNEIRVVQESLIKSLMAVHHGRIRYPDQKTA